MKTRSILGTVALLLSGLALTFGIATAQGADHGPGNGRGGDKVMKELNLTDAQKAQIKQIRDAFKQQNSSQIAQLKSLRDQMKAAREAKNTDQMKSLRDQMKTAMEAMKPAHEKLRADIAAVLTPEQRAKLEQLKADRKENRGERRGQRGAGQRGIQ